MILTQNRKFQCRIAALALLLLAWTGLALVAHGEQKSAGVSTNAPAASHHGLINVNTADATTLETLPGVGPTTAQRIIDGRPYHKLSDLENVKGLSPAKVEALKGKVSFGQPKAARETTADSKTSQDSATASSAPKHAAPASTGNAPTASNSGGAASSSHATANKLAPGEKININTASAEDLDRLPGIGKTKAQAIVEYRTQNGNFKTLEDIEKVKGIKAGSFEKLKDHIKLSD